MLNSICEKCICLNDTCKGTTEQVWTGCVYRKLNNIKPEQQYYFNHIVKRHLQELQKSIVESTTEPEKAFYNNRYNVQLKDYATVLNISITELKAITK